MKLQNQNINKEKQIKEAFEILNKENIESLCVVDSCNEKLGTVSITDIRKAIELGIKEKPISLITRYFEDIDETSISIDKDEIKNRINKILPESIKEAISTCSKLAEKEKLNIYLVGGLVRDLIRNSQNLDLDITMESNGIDFAKKLAQNNYTVILKEIHEDFGTAKVVINTSEKDIDIDIASTRQEYYKYPGALPTISEYNCELKEDLFRRDFTINAMAINIHPESYGQITDNLGGLSDIKNKLVRILHPVSFIDDPTRIIRGIEFAVRFDFRFSQATETLINETIKSKLFDNFCTERLKLELKPCLNLNQIKVIELLKRYGLTNLIDPEIELKSMESFNKLIINTNKYINYINKEKIWLIQLGCILSNLPDFNVERILEKLYLTNIEKQIIKDGLHLLNLSNEIEKADKPSQIYNIFNNKPPESILISTFKNNKKELIEKVHCYFENYSKTTIDTTGKTLIKLGIKPGPLFSEIFNTLLELKLDGKISNQAQEISFIKENYIS